MTLSRRGGLAGALALIALGAFASVAAANPNSAVSIVGKSFTPKDITVNGGDTVTWTVMQSIGELHTVTSGKPGDAQVGTVFDSGLTLKDNGQGYQFQFTTAGTFAYFCQVHPVDMTGTITVVGAAGSGPPAASGGPGQSGHPGPPSGEGESVPAQDKLVAAGILVVAIVLLFGAAMVYRRFNHI